jgi:hypothetical protein
MRHRTLALFTAFCLCLAAGFAVLAAEQAPPKASDAPNARGAQDQPETPLTIDQVIALLEAKVGEKVILRQIESTGTRLTMTVDTLLSLKAAGASDALLEALQEETTPHAAAPEMKPVPKAAPAMDGTQGEYPFRVFLMEDNSGGRVVHITNLDENGKRIGGELPEDDRASRNVVTRGEHASSPPAERREPPADDSEGYAAGYAEGGNGQQPVIVNVYNQAPASPGDGTALIGGSEPIGGDAFINTGIYPGYFNYGYGYSPTVYPHGALVGPRYGYGGIIYSPPGSYSHYIRYHRPYGAHSFKQATPWSPAYRWGVPASVRNQAAFGRR